MFDVERMRGAMPAARNQVYLNTGTFGPTPEPSIVAMETELREAHANARIGAAAFRTWLRVEGAARSAFARVVAAAPESIALGHSTTDGVNLVLAGRTWSEGDEVLTTDAEHPGLSVPLAILARRRGVVVRTLPLAGAPDPVALVAAAVTRRTRLVALSHVLWTTGRVLPIAEITAVAHAAGAAVLVDGAQSVGCVAVDAPGLGADYYTISGQKWLCGPSGTGALYVAPHALDGLESAFAGYPTVDPRTGESWSSARRLDVGTVGSTLLVGATAAMSFREQLGIDAGITRANELAAALRQRLAGTPEIDLVDVDVPSSLVAFRLVDGRSAEAVVAALETRGVLVRSIPGLGLVRASVGPWNTEEDLARLVEGLADPSLGRGHG